MADPAHGRENRAGQATLSTAAMRQYGHIPRDSGATVSLAVAASQHGALEHPQRVLGSTASTSRTTAPWRRIPSITRSGDSRCNTRRSVSAGPPSSSTIGGSRDPRPLGYCQVHRVSARVSPQHVLQLPPRREQPAPCRRGPATINGPSWSAVAQGPKACERPADRSPFHSGTETGTLVIRASVSAVRDRCCAISDAASSGCRAVIASISCQCSACCCATPRSAAPART